MKTRILICCIFFMLMTFAGNALAVMDGQTDNANTFYGVGAGGLIMADPVNNTGQKNTFIGKNAGYNTTTGNYNNFIGDNAGFSNSTGGTNNFIGYMAGYKNNGNQNTFNGYKAGYENTTGYDNTFLGYYAGIYNSTGHFNIFIGSYAGQGVHGNTTGSSNTFLGYAAGNQNTTGSENTFTGYQSGFNTTTGTGNTFFGISSGSNNTVEDSNTLIGYSANIDNAAPGSVQNATAIGSRAYVSTANSLVLGSIAGVNSAASSVNVGIGTSAPARQLHLVGDNAVFRMDRTKNTAAFMMVRTDVSGNPMKTFVVGANASASGVGTFVINDLGASISGSGANRMTINNDGSVTFTGNVYANAFGPSSMAYKDNIRTYENALDTVSKLRGVKFDWKDSGKPAVGLIAEEVDGVIPEVVAHNGTNATGVNYASLVGVLVEAVKEQQGLIKALQEKNEKLEQRLTIIEEK